MFSHIILLCNADDIAEAFNFMMDHTIDIYGLHDETPSTHKINLEANTLCAQLYNQYYLDQMGKIMHVKAISENYVIKIIWNEAIIAFAQSQE